MKKMDRTNAPPNLGLLHTLRKDTSRDHYKLDHHPHIAELVKGRLTIDTYRRIIKSLYWVFSAMHSHIGASMAKLGFNKPYIVSNRLAWLREDLCNLQTEGAAFPDGNPLDNWQIPEVDTVAKLIGEIYVLEGSTLGGQVISRIVGNQLGLTAHNGARFFHGHGAQTPVRWAAFSSLAEHTVPRNRYEECSEAARKCLQNFISALSVAHVFWQEIEADSGSE